MHILLAIASITFKDAIRKKVLVTLLFFTILVVVSGLLPSSGPEGRIRQMTQICLGGIGFFGMVAAVFLSAPNLPDDISKKTIFTVMTKPARRWHILAGKILGLAYVMAVLLVVMGTLSFANIRFWDWKLGAEEGGPARLDGHKRTYAREIENRGQKLTVSAPMIESDRAIASGIDRMTFTFEGLQSERFRGEKVFAEVVLFCHGFSYDKASGGEGTALLEVKNPTTGEIASEIFGAESLQPVKIGFDRRLIDDRGRVLISVIRRLKSGSYSAIARSVTVLSQPSGYGMNFVKAMALLFMQFMVLVSVATMASTFLTSTVSTITAFFIYFTGSLTELLRAQALKFGTHTNVFTMSEHSHGHGHGAEEAITGATLVANYLFRYFYLGISVVFPDLSAYNPTGRVSGGEYISHSMLWSGLLYGVFYSALAFLGAWVIFRRKEVA